MKFDVPVPRPVPSGCRVGLTDGTASTPPSGPSWYTNPKIKVLAGDFNGDGRADVMKFDVASSAPGALGQWRAVRISRAPRCPTPRSTWPCALPGRLYHGRRERGAWAGFTSVPLGETLSGDPALVSAGRDRLVAAADQLIGAAAPTYPAARGASYRRRRFPPA